MCVECQGEMELRNKQRDSVKERGMIFNAEMVSAILDGRKTQTRRLLKQATGPSLSVDTVEDSPDVAELSWLYGDGHGHEVHEHIKLVHCPFGKPGDRILGARDFR